MTNQLAFYASIPLVNADSILDSPFVKEVGGKRMDEGIKLTRRDLLTNSALAALGLSIGLPRATVAAADVTKLAPDGAVIDHLAIYPAIGISRIGNSPEIFEAPEIPGYVSPPQGGYKDAQGRLKKQVQRFRVFAFDDQGRVIREVNAENGDKITWEVHVANTKGAWYQFNSPMDMGAQTPGLTGQMRNQGIAGVEREALLIDPGVKRIEGQNADSIVMDGDFWLKPHVTRVKLGELRTDDKGRLLVVPGDGAGGPVTPINPIVSFSDNDGYYDDWCDGPVKAKVTLSANSKTTAAVMDAQHAWVACCGPDFVPDIPSFTTMYDVIRDTMVNGKVAAGGKPLMPPLSESISFRTEIHPIFERLGLMEWIASAAQLRTGWIDVGSFLEEDYIKKIADPSESNKPFRQELFDKFRNPDKTAVEAYKLPYMLGSGANYDQSPAHWYLMPKLQYHILQKWLAGEFYNDLDAPEAKITRFEDVPREQQPDALTQAAMEHCSGGAFHPGVELPWILRQPAMFGDGKPFRLRLGHRPSLLQNDAVGEQMSPVTAFDSTAALVGNPADKTGEAYVFKPGPKAPIGPQMQGDLTRWMGLPWFGDAFSCALAIDYANDFPLANWWPALTPIDVLPELYFNQLAADDVSDSEKLKFFEKRVPWVRGVRGIGLHVNASYLDGLSRARALWHGFGVIVKRPRPDNLSDELKKIIPEYLYVETGRGTMDLLYNEQPNPGRHST